MDADFVLLPALMLGYLKKKAKEQRKEAKEHWEKIQSDPLKFLLTKRWKMWGKSSLA